MSEELIRPVSSCLRTVIGEHVLIRDKSQLQLRIGSLLVSQELWIVDIQDECILGLDFLQSHNCLVDLKSGALTIGEEDIPLKKPWGSLLQSCSR